MKFYIPLGLNKSAAMKRWPDYTVLKSQGGYGEVAITQVCIRQVCVCVVKMGAATL